MNEFYLYRKAWRYKGPPHEEPQLDRKGWEALLNQGGLLVRNTYNFDCQETTSFWYVVKDQFEGMEELSSNERNKVRKSLKTLDFKLVDPELLKTEGWSILKATYDDYSVSDRKMDERVFLQYLEECSKQPFDYWGIFDKERLVGFCTVWLWSAESCEYGLIGMMPEYKHNNSYPYYGLFYSLNAYYLGEKLFQYVTDGARTITEHSNIQDFLIDNFHFRKAYCHLTIHYKWWMKLAVKILYPFRKLITIPSVKAVLNMESMTR
jgi:hypothetical protein